MPILNLVWVVIVMMGVWAFLRGKIAGPAGLDAPHPVAEHIRTAHEIAHNHAFLVAGAVLVGIALLGPLLTAITVRQRHRNRPDDLDPDVTSKARGWWSPAEVFAVCLPPALSAGAMLGTALCAAAGPSAGPGTDATVMLARLLPWQAAGTLAAVSVLVAHLHRAGLWDAARYPGHPGTPDRRSDVRRLSRRPGMTLDSAVRWSGEFDARQLHWNGQASDPGTVHTEDLPEWDALIGPTAPLWAAAGFTLDDAAWLAALPPWHPNRPSDAALRSAQTITAEVGLRHARAILDGAGMTQPDLFSDRWLLESADRAIAGRCVTGLFCPAHDPDVERLLTEAPAW